MLYVCILFSGYRQSSPRLDAFRTGVNSFNDSYRSYIDTDWYKGGSYMSLMDRSAPIMTARPLYPHETGAYGGWTDTVHSTSQSSCHGCCAELQLLQSKVKGLEAAVEQLSKKRVNAKKLSEIVIC